MESCKALSSSAPCAIGDELPLQKLPLNEDSNNSFNSEQARMQRLSKDSAMEDGNEDCRSLSGFTDSTEQSAAVNFDMSNRVRKQCFDGYLNKM